MSPFFLQMAALRHVKAPEWQAENLTATGKNVKAKKSHSQAAASRTVVFWRKGKNKVSCGRSGGSQAVNAEGDSEEGYREMCRMSHGKEPSNLAA